MWAEFSLAGVLFAFVQVAAMTGFVLWAYRRGRRDAIDELWADSEWVNDPHNPTDPPNGNMDVVGGVVRRDACGRSEK